MKKSSLIKSVLLITVVLITMSQTLKAQREFRQNRGMYNSRPQYPSFSQNIPDLTEDQEMKIRELKTAHMKNMIKYKSELEEKNARLRSLQTADDVDMDKIYKVIDDIGAIETKIAKERADLHQEIRTILNDEQRIFFDTQYLKRKMYNHGAGYVQHHGQAFEKE
jgi:Spy/CpxP family protein refolding chaperone